jgi:hypothetical protein
MTDQELAEANARIEQLLHEFGAHSDEDVGAGVHELVRLLSGLYGAGLGRALTLIGAHPQGGAAVVARLGEDPLVGALLALHDLHPLDLPQRVAGAVERVRSFAAMRGASVTLVEATADVARLRIDIATPTGSAAADDIALALHEAIGRMAPDVRHVRIDRSDMQPAAPLIQITRSRPAAAPAPGVERRR